MKLRHVGIGTNKIGYSIEFYHRLGFRVISDVFECGEYLDKFFRIKDICLKIIKMRNECNDIIELIDFSNRDVSENNDSLIKLGLTHIAVTTRCLEEIKKNIKALDVVCTEQLTPSGVKVMFIKDPNNIFIELVEET